MPYKYAMYAHYDDNELANYTLNQHSHNTLATELAFRINTHFQVVSELQEKVHELENAIKMLNIKYKLTNFNKINYYLSQQVSDINKLVSKSKRVYKNSEQFKQKKNKYIKNVVDIKEAMDIILFRYSRLFKKLKKIENNYENLSLKIFKLIKQFKQLE